MNEIGGTCSTRRVRENIHEIFVEKLKEMYHLENVRADNIKMDLIRERL
jgi:hypothetical protein